MRVLTDENVSPRFGVLLEQCFPGIDASSVQKYFGRGVKDREWLGAVRDWHPKPVALGCDRNITKKGYEKQALMDAEIHYVLFTASFTQLKLHEQAWRFLKIWPRIESELKRAEAPILVSVNLLTNRMTVTHTRIGKAKRGRIPS